MVEVLFCRSCFLFDVGQKVVYFNYGVGVVEFIGESLIDGIEQVYYYL